MCDVTCTTAGGNTQPRWQPTTAGDAVVTATVTTLLTVADSEAPDCHSKVGIDPFLFFRNSLCAQPALYSPRFTKLLSKKCVAQMWTFGLCCSVVNKSWQWFLTASTFGRPKVLFLSHRKTVSPWHDCINTTAVTETTPPFFAWTLGWHYTNISKSWLTCGDVFKWGVLAQSWSVFSFR